MVDILVPVHHPAIIRIRIKRVGDRPGVCIRYKHRRISPVYRAGAIRIRHTRRKPEFGTILQSVVIRIRISRVCTVDFYFIIVIYSVIISVKVPWITPDYGFFRIR